MKKIKLLIPMIIILLCLLGSVVYGITIENAINENHQVSLVSDIYSIDINNSNNELNYINKGINDNNIEIKKDVTSNINVVFDYTIIAISNGGSLNEGVVYKDRITKTIDSNTDVLNIIPTDSIYGLTCTLVVIPYQSYNRFISDFTDLQMLNNEFRHQVINNDSEITDYNTMIDIYNSNVYKDIYLLNDITISSDYIINIPCSLHLLNNNIILNSNLLYEHFYKGNYIINSINGVVIKNTYTFTIHTPLALIIQNELNADAYVLNNNSLSYVDALNFAYGFFSENLENNSADYAVLFETPILPYNFIDKNIRLNYYTNYLTTKESFCVNRTNDNEFIEVTIEACDNNGIVLGTRSVNVCVVGTSDNDESIILSKILERITKNCLNNNTKRVSINLSDTLNSFLVYTDKDILLTGNDYINNYVLTGVGVELDISEGYLTIERNTYNGFGYIYINNSDTIFAKIELLSLDINDILEIIENDIGQIFFSTGNVYYPITSEEEYEQTYNLSNVTYELKEVFSDIESDTTSITYDNGNLRIVNINAVYNLLYTYFLKIIVENNDEIYTIQKEIIVPSSATGSGEQNSIVSNLFTTNFNTMSNFIGTSNNFSSSFANFYMEIANQDDISSYINIYNVSDDSLFDGTQTINDRRFYFKTIDSNIPTTETIVYVNVYVTDKDQYASGNSLKQAYLDLQSFDIKNGLFTANSVPITRIYNSNNEIYITYDGSNNVINISSDDYVVTMENSIIDLTSYSYDIVNEETILTSSIFYDNGNPANAITVFLQEYSFIIPGIYNKDIFGSTLYELLMDQYGYFEEILPTDSIEEKEHYLLTNAIKKYNDLFTNVITLTYENSICTGVNNIYNSNNEYNIKLHDYFYYIGNTKYTTFYMNDYETLINSEENYNLINGLYDDDGNPIFTIYKDISSLTNYSIISSLRNLSKTICFDIRKVNISYNDLYEMININNDYLKTLILQDCNITDTNRLNFSKYTNLETVDLSNNNIRTVPMFQMRMNNLNLKNNLIEDINNISELYSLKILNLENNKIKEFLPLQTLDELESVYLSNNIPDNVIINIDGGITGYGSNGSINIPTLVILLEKGINVYNNYIPSSVNKEKEACYDINSIVILDEYHSAFTLDLSQHTGYNLDFDLDNVYDMSINLSFTIYINNTAITNVNNMFSYNTAGTYDAIIKMVYTNTDYTVNPNVIETKIIYRLIHFTILNN